MKMPLCATVHVRVKGMVGLGLYGDADLVPPCWVESVRVRGLDESADLRDHVAETHCYPGLIAHHRPKLEHAQHGEDIIPCQGLQDPGGPKHGSEGCGEAGGSDPEHDLPPVGLEPVWANNMRRQLAWGCGSS